MANGDLAVWWENNHLREKFYVNGKTKISTWKEFNTKESKSHKEKWLRPRIFL